MTLPRKILVVAAVAFGVMLAALLVLPSLFKDRIAARVHAEVGKGADPDPVNPTRRARRPPEGAR